MQSKGPSERERLAAWMTERSFSTGHGDTFEDLLKELDWQVKELRGARLEEADWWRYLAQMHDESYFAVEGDKRIAALAQALQPEEKEGK